MREEVAKIIDRLAIIYDEEDIESEVIKSELDNLEKRLEELTGKAIDDCKPFEQYWSYSSLDEIVDRILEPEADSKSMSDEEIKEEIIKIASLEYKPAEMDKRIKMLQEVTGLKNISDYIFWPTEIGLDMHASKEDIAAKVLLDMKS